MKLTKIFDVNVKKDIRNLMSDSRIQSDSAMFFCLEGVSYDGHDFVDEAIANGAICIVHSKALEKRNKEVTYIKVNDVQIALNQAINAFYSNCFSKMHIMGVTGTAGKSTVAYWLSAMINEFEPCGYIGSLGVTYPGYKTIDNFTHSEEIVLADFLHQMYKGGVKSCALALSSISLELQNADFLEYDTAIFTHFSSEHLDFHGTINNYLTAKKKLFDNLGSNKVAIVNADDSVAKEMVADSLAEVISYGIDKNADFQAINPVYTAKNTTFTLVHKNQNYDVISNIIGDFNLYNLLAVIACLYHLKKPLDDILRLVKKMPVVSGRMEVIDQGQNFNVIVDYAHTVEGYEKVLSFAQRATTTRGRLIVVFGAPGKRDSSKRQILGQVADKYANLIILTEEDQRNENPQEIATQIIKGIKNTEYYFIEEREYAIEQAISVAQKGDTVVILAKGDELFIDRGLGKMMYNYKGDAQVAKDCLRSTVR